MSQVDDRCFSLEVAVKLTLQNLSFIFLARIIHQAEKSTGEGDFVIQMSHKTTVSQAYDTPKTISSGLPDTVHIGLRSATGRTASC